MAPLALPAYGVRVFRPGQVLHSATVHRAEGHDGAGAVGNSGSQEFWRIPLHFKGWLAEARFGTEHGKYVHHGRNDYRQARKTVKRCKL